MVNTASEVRSPNRQLTCCYLVRAEIEGENILESVIFALKTLVKILEDESDDTLRLLGYMNEQPAEVAKQIRDVMVSQLYSCPSQLADGRSCAATSS